LVAFATSPGGDPWPLGADGIFLYKKLAFWYVLKVLGMENFGEFHENSKILPPF
jgi:hypothetical protein